MAIAITWLVLDVPPDIDCYEEPSPASAAFHDHAIAIAAVAAVALMATIAWLSGERSRDRRVGRPTAVALAAAGVYLVACLVNHDLFAPIGLVVLVPLAIGGIGAIALLIAAGMLVGALWRTTVALSFMAWVGLLVVLPADVALAWVQAVGPFEC